MSEVTQEDKTMGMLAHLSALVLVGPVIIWMMNKDNPDKAFVSNNAKEALNFQITLFLVMIPLKILFWILLYIPLIGWLGALLLLPVFGLIGLAALALVIIAALKAKEGEQYRYPVSLRLVN